jgi:hypothetical protein
MNQVQILHLFLTDGTDQSERKCSQLSGARPALNFYTLLGSQKLLPRAKVVRQGAGRDLPCLNGHLK